MDGIDYLIEQKIANPDRLGIGGHSYGGFLTSWAITHTDRFKAAVVFSGVTDWFSLGAASGLSSFLQSYFLAMPFSGRSNYDDHSPITFLRNCKTPALILHGEADQSVPLTQGLEFYQGLKMLGVPTEMVIYPRELHAFEERAHQLDLLKRVLAWYDTYLKH
jgi:dipeptidyl aminopeptidase/acylaminoacyl peptidase